MLGKKVNNMEIEIKKIIESDFEPLVNLFHEFAQFEKLPEKMTNSVEKMKQEQQFFNGFTAKNKENEIVGYVTFFFAYYTWTGKALYMDDLYVRQTYRGQNIGTRLIQKVIEFAKSEDCSKLRWQVSNWNEPAIKFYENLGAEINCVEMNCDLLF